MLGLEPGTSDVKSDHNAISATRHYVTNKLNMNVSKFSSFR